MNLNTTFIAKVWEALAFAIVMLGAGAAFGYWNWASHQVVETAAPAVVIAPSAAAPHGGSVAARVDDPAAKPKQSVPNGFKPERVISADIQPIDAQRSADQAATPCPKVHIDATVVRDADGAGRVLISSPDGVTTNATDTVIQSISVVALHPWAAGASYGSDKTYGAWVDRDIGRLRLGVDVLQLQSGGVGARARVGFSFGG